MAPQVPNARSFNGYQKPQTEKTEMRTDTPPKKNVFFTNSFLIAGRICERGLQIYQNGVARFVVANNFGEDSGLVPLYTECVMFAPPGGSIPTELLTKGTPVLASGYRRASTWVDRDGAKHYQVDYVVCELKPIHDSYGNK